MNNRTGWTLTIRLGDVWKDPERDFEQRRDEIVRRIKDSRWFRADTTGELADVVDDLASAPEPWRFDIAWNHLYDLADDARVWVDIYSRPTVSS
jgi:hypothetical protein